MEGWEPRMPVNFISGRVERGLRSSEAKRLSSLSFLVLSTACYCGVTCLCQQQQGGGNPWAPISPPWLQLRASEPGSIPPDSRRGGKPSSRQPRELSPGLNIDH